MVSTMQAEAIQLAMAGKHVKAMKLFAEVLDLHQENEPEFLAQKLFKRRKEREAGSEAKP